MNESKSFPISIKIAVFLIIVHLLIFGLIAARDFLIPISLAVLFAFLLFPLANYIERKLLPRILANLVAILTGISVISGILFILYNQLEVFIDDFPRFRNQALQNFKSIEYLIRDQFGIPVEQQDQWIRNRILNLIETGGENLQQAFSATTSTVTKVGLMPVYVFFLLYYRDKFQQFILISISDKYHGKARYIMDEISFVTKRYMGGIVMVVGILCVLNTLGLLIVGIQYAVLLGVISALMNFIPYFGTLIGGIFPLIVALLTENSLNYALGVIILYIIIQFIENNLLTPNIVGSNVRINPFFTILSLVLGGLIWGLAGMFIVVPFMAMGKIVCDHVDSLKPIGFLLGTEGTEKHALTWKKIKGMVKKNGEVEVKPTDVTKNEDSVHG